MCLNIEEKITFSNWEAYGRAIDYIQFHHGTKKIWGKFVLPIYSSFNGWRELLDSIQEVNKSVKTFGRSIYGEIFVEVR